MRLTILGGSAAGANAGQGCSGYLVETGTTHIMLDAGPGTFPELRRHTDYRSLDGIVISHVHADHTLDLVTLRYALAYNPVKPRKPVPLWMPPNGRRFLDAVATAFAGTESPESFFSDVFSVQEYDPAESLVLGDAAISFMPMVHYIPCWAVRVEGAQDGSVLAYTADTGPASDLTSLVNGASVLVADAGNPTPEREPFEQRGHATAAEMAAVAQRYDVKTFVLAHLWEEFGFGRYQADAAAVFNGRIEIARPGLRIEW